MKYIEAKPKSIVHNYVKCFWYLEKEYPTVHLADETILPDDCLDFVFQLDDNGLHLKTDNGLLRQPASFAIGQQKTPTQLTANGKSVTAGIRFLAYGAYPFLRLPINRLHGPTINLDHLFGKSAVELSERIKGLSARNIFKEFEKFLLSHLSTSPREIDEIKFATEILFQDAGATDIARLAFDLHQSTRTLERRFDEVVGVSPKSFARVIRFDQIKNELILNPQVSLTNLSFRYGYFDQAHFIRDFKQFTGKTPSVFRTEVAKQPLYFYK